MFDNVAVARLRARPRVVHLLRRRMKMPIIARCCFLRTRPRRRLLHPFCNRALNDRLSTIVRSFPNFEYRNRRVHNQFHKQTRLSSIGFMFQSRCTRGFASGRVDSVMHAVST